MEGHEENSPTSQSQRAGVFLANNEEDLSDWLRSVFLAIGTFGHGENLVSVCSSTSVPLDASDHDELKSSFGDRSEEELQHGSNTTTTALPDTINSSTHSVVLDYIRKRIRALQEEYKHIQESLSPDHELQLLKISMCLKEFQEIEKYPVPSQLGHPFSVNENMNTSTVAATHFCSFQERSRWNEVDKMGRTKDKERYLCVSDGFVIYCLDLKSKDYRPGQTLPKTSTLKLLDEGLPVSMGLFKNGSAAYMVSGQEFRGYKKLGCPYVDRARWLYNKYGFMGSSRKTYHLCGGDEGRLSLSECNHIPLLKKPKFWPIVERIGNEIHVIESIPWIYPRPRLFPSHEILDLKGVDRGWMKLPPMRHPEDERLGLFITNHLVVGDKIYATIYDSLGEWFVFDSKSKNREWERHEVCSTDHVSTVLFDGKAICSGQVLQGVASEGALYVVIGIEDVRSGGKPNIVAVAYLVDEMGDVLLSWDLPDFFEGLEKPFNMLEASLFRMEEEEEGKSRCVCVVVLGMDCSTTRLYVSTCSVEVDEEAAAAAAAANKKPPSPTSVLRELPPYRSPTCSEDDNDDDDDAVKVLSGVDTPQASLVGLVKVVVKKRQVYQVGRIDMRGEGSAETHDIPRLTACFL